MSQQQEVQSFTVYSGINKQGDLYVAEVNFIDFFIGLNFTF